MQILLDHTTTVTIMSISCLRKDRLRQIGRWLKAIKQLQKIVVEKLKLKSKLNIHITFLRQ